MSNVLRLAIVDPKDSTRDALKSTLLGMDMVWLEAECSRYEFFSDVVAQTHPDIGIVSLNHNLEKALQLVHRRQPYLASHAGGRQRFLAPAGAHRRPGRGPGTHRKSALRTRRRQVA